MQNIFPQGGQRTAKTMCTAKIRCIFVGPKQVLDCDTFTDPERYFCSIFAVHMILGVLCQSCEKTPGPEPRLVCLTQPSNPIKTLLPQPRQRFRNGETPSNGVFPEGPECDAKVCLTRPSNPLKTLGPEPRLVCLTQPSNPIKTLLPQPRQRFRNGETPSNGVFPEGPECDAKVCLTRPSNPLKTLGPEPRLVCFAQPSNPIKTLLPQPRQRLRNGETPSNGVFPEGPECDAKVCLTRPSNPLKTLGPEPRLVCLTQPSNPIKTLLPQPRQRFRNGETPSNGVFPEGPECDAKVCLTRPSNPLKTL